MDKKIEGIIEGLDNHEERIRKLEESREYFHYVDGKLTKLRQKLRRHRESQTFSAKMAIANFILELIILAFIIILWR